MNNKGSAQELNTARYQYSFEIAWWTEMFVDWL